MMDMAAVPAYLPCTLRSHKHLRSTEYRYLKYCREQSRRDPSFVRIIDEALPVEAAATDAKCEAKMD